jgi:2-dehydropantoate 2-reductase
MKIGIFGAGAIGSFFGGLLAYYHSKAEVILVGRGAHAEAVRSAGKLTLLLGDAPLEVPVRMEFDPQTLAGCRLILFCVKSHATAAALAETAPYFRDASLVVLQNGICDHLFIRHFAKEQLVAGMTAINVAVVSPGVVSLQLNGVTMLGPMFPEGVQAARSATPWLGTRQAAVIFTPQIQGVRYTKLAINAIGYVSCLSASNFITEALLHPDWRRYVAVPLVREIEAVFRASGIQPKPIPKRPTLSGLKRICHMLDLPIVGGAVASAARRMFNRRPIVFSLYQDLKAGKKTEVDFINGEIVRLAREAGVSAPLNQLVVQMVHELESRGAGNFFTRQEVIGRFQAARSC